MTTRWEVERALVKSQLEPSARLVVFALLVKADNDTAVILPDKTPSLTELQAMTGLSRSALVEWLNALDEAGWVKRSRGLPDRTQYALDRGQPTAERARKKQSVQRPSPPNGLVRTADHQTPDLDRSGSPHSGPSVGEGSPPNGPEGAEGSPHNGLPSYSSKSSSPTGKNKSSSGRRRKVSDHPRPDVERVCLHLADWIVRNGSKAPEDPLSKKWRDAARLLIDTDKRTEEQVMMAIDWCQQDEFWRGIVLSMPKLREKYDQLRLAWKRKPRPSPNGSTTGQNRHVDDLPPKEREERNPFAGAVRSSQAARNRP